MACGMIGTSWFWKHSRNILETEKKAEVWIMGNTPVFVYCLGVDRIHNVKLSFRGLAFVVSKLFDVTPG